MQTIEQASGPLSDPQAAGDPLTSEPGPFARQNTQSNPLLLWSLEATAWLAPFVVLFAVDEIGLLSRFSASLFVLTVFFLLVAMLGNIRASAIVSGVLVAAIAGISFAKIEFLGVPFVVNDIFYLTGESLRATLMIQTPASRIAQVVNAPAGQLARVLNAYAEKGEAA